MHCGRGMGPWEQGPVCLSVGGRRAEDERGFGVAMLPRWRSGKEPACQCRDARDTGLIPGSGRFPGRGNGNPLQYFCLGNPMDRGYSPWDGKELDMTEQLTL